MPVRRLQTDRPRWRPPHLELVEPSVNEQAAEGRQRRTARRRLSLEDTLMRWQDHIVATPDTLHGSPRFRGTRIPVAVVLDNLAAGVTAAELHAEYPTLPKEAVPAALAYAAELARDQIVPITA